MTTMLCVKIQMDRIHVLVEKDTLEMDSSAQVI